MYTYVCVTLSALCYQERDQLRGEVNMGAIEQYRKKEAEYSERVAELDAVTAERDAASIF